MRGHSHDDEGSVMPLAVGFMGIALALILLTVVIMDIYSAQRKLYAWADSAALAAATSYSPAASAEPGIVFTDSSVESAASEYMSRVEISKPFSSLSVRGTSPDSLSVVVEVSAVYRPVWLSVLVPRGIPMQAEADARGALRQ